MIEGLWLWYDPKDLNGGYFITEKLGVWSDSCEQVPLAWVKSERGHDDLRVMCAVHFPYNASDRKRAKGISITSYGQWSQEQNFDLQRRIEELEALPPVEVAEPDAPVAEAAEVVADGGKSWSKGTYKNVRSGWMEKCFALICAITDSDWTEADRLVAEYQQHPDFEPSSSKEWLRRTHELSTIYSQNMFDAASSLCEKYANIGPMRVLCDRRLCMIHCVKSRIY